MLWLTLAATTWAFPLAAEEPAQKAAEQGAPATVASEPAEAAPANRPAIRVLRNPYDLASFYRAGGGLGPWAGLPNDPAYGIADFYRANPGAQAKYGWSAFWTNGYSTPRPAPFPSYRRTIGENGDLFLVVPFLAPVGPISGAFFGY
jgi:hypothetical protein